ncbi:N-glycosidase [Ditylenchus destructor]|nr:N-glycosidase [Ditylenchus destructor]
MHEKSIFAIANSTNDATTRKYEDLGRKIMQLKNPAKIKQLGNVVQNTPGFDKVNWDKAKVDIMKKAVYHKFTQNATLHDALMNTEGSILVEASPFDSFWGASCGTDDPRIVDYKNYEGENMLGQILMEIRDKWIANKKGSKQRLAIKMKKKHF